MKSEIESKFDSKCLKISKVVQGTFREHSARAGNIQRAFREHSVSSGNIQRAFREHSVSSGNIQ
jgi:hypothetical protein